jgi:hypothetical protein
VPIGCYVAPLFSAQWLLYVPPRFSAQWLLYVPPRFSAQCLLYVPPRFSAQWFLYIAPRFSAQWLLYLPPRLTFRPLRSTNRLLLPVVCGSQNTQWLFPYTTLLACFCNRDEACLTVPCNWLTTLEQRNIYNIKMVKANYTLSTGYEILVGV